MEVQVGEIQIIQGNLPYLAVEGAIAIFELILLLVYVCKYHPSAPIVAILALLLFNDFFQLLFELATFINEPPFVLCLISITGSSFFRLASYYWLIFITKLIYREKATPGKEVNLLKQVGKNLIITYLPSIMVSFLILIVANLDDTANRSSCYKIIREKQFTDYVVFMASFVLPPLVAALVIIGYLFAYLRLCARNHSIFLIYPIIAVPFMAYYLTVKLTAFFGIDFLNGNGQIPLAIEPLTHCIVFILTLRKVDRAGGGQTASQLTLNVENIHDSLVIMQD